MTPPSPPIPLHISIELLKHHEDDRLEHEVRVGLAGVKDPLYCCDIESMFGDWAHIRTWYYCDQRLEIPVRIRDHLIFTCFEILLSAMMEHAGSAASRQFRCARSWLQTNFLTAEADLIAEALVEQVVPGLIVDDQTSVTIG